MDKRSVLQPIEPSTEAAFNSAVEAGNSTTNIYGWEGETPKPGYYRQGGTLIEIFHLPEEGVIGVAVSA